MAQLKFNGNIINTCGDLPKVGEKAPDFILTKKDLTDFYLKDVEGKKVVINIFPSIDTPICSMSVRRFNQEISNYPNAVVICASLDLPFAHARFCETEGIENVISASELRNRDFGDNYGLRMTTGPLKGLLARAVVVLDENGYVIYSKIVDDLKNEPKYDEVINLLEKDDYRQDELSKTCIKTFTAEHSRNQDQDEPCNDGR